MGRFLIVVPPLVGHTNPTVSLGGELVARGHDVAWAGHPEVAAMLPPGAPLLPVAGAPPPEIVEAAAVRNRAPVGGAVGFKAVWEEIVLPLARHMVPGVEAVTDDFGPDVLVVDQQALAGAAVALRRGLPWATTATTSAELIDPLAYVPRVRAWLRDEMRRVLVDAGVDVARAEAVDPRFSPELVIGLTTPGLVGPGPFPDHWALVGPALSDRHDDTPFPWDWLDGVRPAVLVSLGTVNWRAGARFFAVAAEALGGMDVQAVIVAPPDLVPDRPPNVLVLSRVPQLALLERVAAVVGHGGHNTVVEALAAGVPLVLAPLRDDQPIVADQVVRAGAGVRVKFHRVTAPALRAAVASVLEAPAHREAAARVRASFAAAGGARAAADRLEGLLAPAGVAASPTVRRTATEQSTGSVTLGAEPDLTEPGTGRGAPGR
jgi:MGT family glycosyltransferase